MAPIRDSVSHSPNQSGLEHPGLDSQYEPSSWSSGSPCGSDNNSNWGKVLVDESTGKPNNPSSTNSSVWPPSTFSCSSSSSSSGCGSGSDPELASECMDADSSSSLGSEKNLSAVAVTAVMMMSTNASSSVSSTASSPSSAMMVSVSVNGESNGNSRQVVQAISGAVGTISDANNGNNITGSSHYSMAGSSSIGSNNMGNHNIKLVSNSGVWGTQSGSSIKATGGSTPCINGGLNPNTFNPNANHGAWPQNPTPSPASQVQRPPQGQGMNSKLGIAPQQSPLLGWGGMAAPDNSIMMEDTDVNSGTASSKALGSSIRGNGGLQPTNLNTESNGPNNTIMMNTTTTTTNATMTSSPPNSTASLQLSGDCSWGSVGGGNGGPLANGNPSTAPQNSQGELGSAGAFGTPWGTTTYSGDKGPQVADTVNPQNPALIQAGNPQISSAAAYKSNNNHNNGAPHWDQGPPNPNQPQSNMPWGVGSNQIPSPAGTGNGTQSMAGPPVGIPRPWGSSASSSSSSSSSSSASNKISNGEWGSAAPDNSSDATGQKGSSTNNGWKSLEDDAIGMGVGGGVGGVHGLGSVSGGWGRSGGSEGSGESSGGQSSSDRDGYQPKGGNRRKGAPSATVISAVSRAEVDPRVLSNTGWGQTPIQQNTAWDVNSPAHNQSPGLRGDERKHSSGGSSWGTATATGPSQTSGGWGGRSGNSGPDTGSSSWGDQRPTTGWDSKVPASGGGGQSGWDDGSSYKGSTTNSNAWSNNFNKDDRSNTWTNAPKPQQGWGSNVGNGTEGWGNGVNGARVGANNHWGEPQKGASSVGWDSDSDRSGSGCWSEPSRTNTSSSNTWVGSGGSNTPDQSTQNQGSSWGDSVHKPNPQSNSQGWGEPMKNNHGAQNWGELKPKASNEWGKAPESNMSRGNQCPNKPTGWLGGPMPTVGQKEEMSTGWEEPSPESIRRRMEIDDGTAAWGDPGKYSGGSVNMWNKNSPSDNETMTQHQSHPVHNSMHPPQPMQPPAQDKSCSSGWGHPYPQQKESSSWGESAPVPPVTVDNGTSAWGKPMDSSSRWDESNRDSRESKSNWGGQHKSAQGPKPMETWCGEEVSIGNSWDQEEEVEIGMWSNSQQDNRSHDQSSWNYKQKSSNKMSKPVSKQDEPWMKPFINQFGNMNFPRDSPDDSMKTGAGMVQDKRMDMGNMGDFNGVMGKNPGSRHQSTMDRSSYFDKLSAPHSAYDSPASDEFSSNQSISFSPSNSTQPVSCLDSEPSPAHYSPGAARQNVNPMLGGSIVAQGRGGPQSQVAPQPNLRNQVPPPILPSQVPPSLLKYPGGNGGLNPLFGPQQVAVLNQLSQLSQLSQLNQINQLQRLLLQQQKVQNQRTMPVGRQTEQTRPVGSSPSMMQPPRHLDPSLLKQTPPLKPYLDTYLSHNTPEMQKDSAALGSFSNFPLSLNSNLNVSLDMGVGGGSTGGGAVSYKEPPQSRLKKLWATDPLEQNSKPGAMSSGLRLEDSPFYDFLSPGPSPLSPPCQSMVGDGWPPRANSPPPHGNTVTWPPEFRPGEPWKGYPNIDPETDPYVTPGSVINNLSINTVRDTDHLRDRNNGPSSSLNTTMPSNSAWSSIRASSHSGSLTSTAQSTSVRPSESKWSPSGGSVSNSSLAHELWKVPLPPKASVAAPSRPPPGLTSQKPSPASSGWDAPSLRLGGWGSSESRYTPGSSWGDSSSSGRTQWLVLKNLTPQIDGSTLRTLCMQHGPLITFHLNLPHGNAVVCYSSKDEAAKAQKSLHMCVLGNTTILAEFASEEEINRFFAQGQSLATPSSSWQAIGSSQSRMDQSHPFPSRAPEPNQWNSSNLHSSSLWGGPNYSSSLWGNSSGTEAGRISSPSSISSFLPVDHLTGGGDSM